MSEYNLIKLLNRRDKLQKDRYDVKKLQEYYTREKVAAEDDKKFKKAKDKEEFLRQRLTNLDGEILSVQNQIQDLEKSLKEEEYSKSLKDFYQKAVKGLTSLKGALKERKISDAVAGLDGLEEVFQQSTFVRKEDLKRINEYLSLQSVRIRIGVISEEMSKEVGINASFGGTSVSAQKRANVLTWIQQLSGQVNTLITMLEKRMGEAPK